jgi:hypothetical protein
MRTNSAEDIQYNKKIENTTEEVEQYSLVFLSFIDSTDKQIPRPIDIRRHKVYYSLGKKKRHTIKNQIVVNNQGYIPHKTANHKKGRRHIIIYKNIKRIILLLQKML